MAVPETALEISLHVAPLSGLYSSVSPRANSAERVALMVSPSSSSLVMKSSFALPVSSEMLSMVTFVLGVERPSKNLISSSSGVAGL